MPDATCMVQNPGVVLEAPEAPVVDSVVANNPTDCNTTDGMVTIYASSSNPLEYRLDGGAWTSSNIFINVAPGTYTPEVRNVDGTCEVSAAPITIVLPTPVTIDSVASTATYSMWCWWS